jgi:hypothetical protein
VWKSTSDAYQAGLPAAVAGIQAVTDDNSSKINSLTSWQGDMNDSITRVEQKADANGASITSLVADIDKYSVGEFSQSYGLTYEQAADILKEGTIYIPTDEHSETFDDTNEVNNFSKYCYYEWKYDNSREVPVFDWMEYSSGVAFSKEVPMANESLKYWYINSDEPLEGYEAYNLYIWKDEQWVRVNSLEYNASNRITSIIRQETDKIAAEVINARGGHAGLNARLEADNKAYVEMVASVVNEDGTVNTASIVTAVNDKGSSAIINGDHIVLNGATTNGDGSFQIHKNGYMTATGGIIGGWNIFDEGIFSVAPYYNELSEYITQSRVTIRQPNARYDDDLGEYINQPVFTAGLRSGTESWTSRISEVDEVPEEKSRDDSIIYKDANGVYHFYYYPKWMTANMEEEVDFYLTTYIEGFRVDGNGEVSCRNGLYVETIDNPFSKEPMIESYFDGGAGFPKDVHFNRDICLDPDVSVPGNGASIWSGNAIYISTKGTAVHTTDHNLTIRLSNTDDGRFQPCINNKMDLGSASLKWKEVYAGTGTINTSDRNAKDNIEPITDVYEQLFMKLLPVSFTFKDGTSGRTHVGFISQDVESAMEELGMTSLDFAGFCRDIKMEDGPNGSETEPVLDENGNVQHLYSLRYSEFIALNTHMIQKLSQRVIDLEDRVSQLEELIKEK